jgi:hypothetical protein
MNQFNVNQLVKFHKKIDKEYPIFLKLSLVKNTNLTDLSFKIKGLVIKRGKVYYRLIRNGVIIESVPENYLLPHG